MNTYPKVNRPNLEKLHPPPFLGTTSSMMETLGLKSPKHPQEVRPPTPPIAPSATKLNNSYFPEPKQSRARRFVGLIKQMKEETPMLYRILLVCLIGLAIPFIIPALGALPLIFV